MRKQGEENLQVLTGMAANADRKSSNEDEGYQPSISRSRGQKSGFVNEQVNEQVKEQINGWKW